MTIFSNSRLSGRLRISCLVTVVGVVAVAAVVLSDANTIAIKLLLLLPLVTVAPGLILGWYRSYSWLALLILVYFIVAVTEVMAPTGNWVDGAHVGLTVIIFFTATFSSRWLQQLTAHSIEHSSMGEK